VFKVGVAYLVVGWLLIQVAATVGSQLNLPDWAPRFITFAIALGFPITLLLAWIFDVGPGGIRREVAVAAPTSSAAPVTSASRRPLCLRRQSVQTQHPRFRTNPSQCCRSPICRPRASRNISQRCG